MPPATHHDHDRRRDRRAVEAAHDLRVVRAERRRSDSRRPRQGRLLLDARRQALPRLQQPVDVREHRPRRRARRRRRSRSRRRSLPYANPFMATEVRARLGAKLAEITPGDIDCFFFTNGGAEANENAIKIARWYTGRHKILARYRSYHGGTAGAITLTGDPRRWAAEPGIPGVVHVPDPYHGIQRGWDTVDDALARARGGDPARRPEHHRRLHPRAGDRHQRHPGAAGRLPAGRPRALRQVRHPDDRRRSDVGLRPHRRVVRGRSLGRRARHPHDGQGADERVRAARRRRPAAQDRRPLPRQGVFRRAHLQQPPAGVRRGAGDDRRVRRGRPDRHAPGRWARSWRGCWRTWPRGTRRSAPSARSACSASSSWCATGRRASRWRRSTAPRPRWRRSASSSARKGSTRSCAGTRSSPIRRCASPRPSCARGSRSSTAAWRSPTPPSR